MALETRVKYRVDDLPWPWRPLWVACSWIIASGLWAVLQLLHFTCRVKVEGSENLAGQDSFIYSLWHQSWFLWCVAFLRSHRRHVWMQHPAAYMKPIHIGLRLMSIRVLLGSGGEEGREAAATLVRLLKEGWSTVISPDGPSGPIQVLKKGVLHIARESGVPVVAVRFETGPCVHLPSWDRKLFPLPFARISVVFGEPVIVTQDNFAEAGKLLAQRMSGAEA
jgi:lysophospholipid acyltransferase (LPLAT)-like uncharacterized protein